MEGSLFVVRIRARRCAPDGPATPVYLAYSVNRVDEADVLRISCRTSTATCKACHATHSPASDPEAVRGASLAAATTEQLRAGRANKPNRATPLEARGLDRKSTR